MKLHRYFSLVTLILILLSPHILTAQSEYIDFESEQWQLFNAQIVEHLGRKCLIGSAALRDVEFENGIIEVDVAVNGERSYCGINFRIQSINNYERVYIRPHRARYYPDAVQYNPVFNRVAGWQLYNGEGYTSSTSIPENEWFHLKLEISGSRARVYVNDMDNPALIINDLKHGISKGGIGLYGTPDRNTYFSNFSYTVDNSLKFETPPYSDTTPGVLSEWQLSQPFKISALEEEQYPDDELLSTVTWQTSNSDKTGLIDISRFVTFSGGEPEFVLAKRIINAEKAHTMKLKFGYSDAVIIYLNGDMLFTGNSAYRYRDPSFLGIVGYFDTIYLPLKKGDNELMLLVAEGFGGWGFMCQDGNTLFLGKDVKKSWETKNVFKIPESVAYDASSNSIFVSNYDGYNPSRGPGRQTISKISIDGSIEKLDWVTGFNNPTGIAVHDGKLFVVHRSGVAEIDISSGKITNQVEIPTPGFLNDLAIDQNGVMYVSDSRRSVIFRIADNQVEEWLSGESIANPNGVAVLDNSLIIGVNGEKALKSVDIDSKEISTIITFATGVIDGIEIDKNKQILMSLNEGQLFRISLSGDVTKLIDSSVKDQNTADFTYISEKNAVVIPTFIDNRVIMYSL